MKVPWYSQRWATVLLHAIAWILLFSLPYLLRPAYGEDSHRPSTSPPRISFLRPLLMNASWIVFFYLNALILIPGLVYRKRYMQYAIFQLFIMIWLVVQAAIIFRVPEQPINIMRHVLFTFFVYLFMLTSSTAYRMVKDRIEADRLDKEKENENLKTELSLLRSQVNPHFMFNVLNNMVSLARKQSDLLEPSLIKLSSLLRYMLYEADEARVSLEKEIEYLQSFIDLQIQRFGKKLSVNVHLPPADRQYRIEPMLLIPFVENAFKHGTGMIEHPQIDVDLRAERNILQFTVRNKFAKNADEIKDGSSGIGLNNVRRRLKLLYGKNHNLMISTSDDWFVVSLQINLS